MTKREERLIHSLISHIGKKMNVYANRECSDTRRVELYDIRQELENGIYEIMRVEKKI